MKVGIYHLKHNRPAYSVLYTAFVEGMKKTGTEHQVIQSSSKGGHKPKNSFDLAVTFTNSPPRVAGVLEKQKEDKNKYLTVYMGAFYKKGVVGTHNINHIYGWDRKSKPKKDALFYFDLLYEDYTEHKFIGEDSDRIEKLNYFNLDIKPWKDDGKYILIPEQIKPEGMGHGITDWTSWAKTKCSEIRDITDMPIKIRRHPNRFAWRKFKKEIKNDFTGIELTDGTSLDEDLKDAYALVTLSSRCVVEATINGVHCFTEDLNSLAYAVCNKKLNLINYPQKFDRKKWLAKVAYSHWSVKELASGDYFNHLKRSVS